MYYPKQIPYLLDEEFKKNINYIEYRFHELDVCCACIWHMESKGVFDTVISNNILPDACIDIVLDFINQTICFAGFSKETEPFHLNQRIDYMGVRLKPGAFYSLFHIEAYKIMDHQIPFSQIETQYPLEEILSIRDLQMRIDCLKKYLLKKVNNMCDKRFVILVDELYESPREQSVVDIARELGYNERQLGRIFMKNYGISPKVLLNILRLHLCLTLLLSGSIKLVDISLQCGFYDQAHFIKEIKRYTGVSPLKLLERYQP